MPVHSSSIEKLGDLFDETKAGANYVYHVFVLQTSEMTDAQFNRRMRKTACPVVWKGHGVQSPVPPSDPSQGRYATAQRGRGFGCWEAARLTGDGSPYPMREWLQR